MRLPFAMLITSLMFGLPVSSHGEGRGDSLTSSAQAGINIRQRFLNKRGFVPYDALVLEPSLVVNRDFGYLGVLEISYYGLFGGDGTVVEHDLSVAHRMMLGPLASIVSWSRYDFMPGSKEAALFEEASLELKLAVPLYPQGFFAYDYRDGSGLVAEVSIGYSAEMLGTNLDVRVALLLNKDYNIEGTTIPGVRIDAVLPLPLSERVTLTPHIRYFIATDNLFKSDYSGGVSLDVNVK